jgi:hypothetical protein
MSRQKIYIGAVPAGEDCEQLGPNYNPKRAQRECVAFVKQLKRTFGDEPEGAELQIEPQRHDFGTYLEVVCYFDENNKQAANYAFGCENEMPEDWDDEAKQELDL